MAWALQMVYSYMLGSFFTPNFASLPQEYNKERPWCIIWKQEVIFWSVKGLYRYPAGSVGADQGLAIPTGIAWPSRAGAGWQLGALAAEQSARGSAVQESVLLWMVTSVTGLCFKRCTNECLSDSNRLRAPKADRKHCTENIGTFRKKVLFSWFSWLTPLRWGEIFILLGCICNLFIISIFLLISYCKWGQ